MLVKSALRRVIDSVLDATHTLLCLKECLMELCKRGTLNAPKEENPMDLNLVTWVAMTVDLCARSSFLQKLLPKFGELLCCSEVDPQRA
ncbi:unnamed protein product [Acanthoscelides obtectus]|uniref:Uncharacterized protein n=1 Tax=Acanthoscelides obtectus TaxID=200917 RepID=A0A9P0L100_ACAOB|nr:unnamed protein product [Acanthoscelides obtectus]CAK1671524.1 hypothetical protein AOBTE_LOCUS28294 [Acanthoscelides obtectus]